MIRFLFVCLALAVLSAPSALLAQRPFPAATDANYRFGPEDVLRIDVWGRGELSGTVVVSYTGEIQIPLLGEVEAEGRTPSELSQDLTQRYQLLEPNVSDVFVSVVDYLSRSVTVLGEVRASGRYGFRELPDIWGAILTAGGATPSAELGAVQLVRADVESGEPRVVTLDLSLGIEGTDISSLPELRPNDQILVPSSDGVPGGGANYQILGAVHAPGIYRVSVASDVIEAIAAAGGPTARADLKKVYVTRASGEGATAYKLNLGDYLREGKPDGNLDVQAGDTITVFERGTFWQTFGLVVSRLMPLVSLTITIILATN